MALARLRPAVPKVWLMAIAGGLWSGVGIMLCRLAIRWLVDLDPPNAYLFWIAGFAGALPAYWFGFSKIALKNISRLEKYPRRVCIFAFQAWKSYLVIVLMMSLGLVLRRSPLPRPHLALLYATIGGGLLLSSFHYYAGLHRAGPKAGLGEEGPGSTPRVR